MWQPAWPPTRHEPRALHGLRYLAAGTMDEAGCTVEECESILGHRTFKMALQYMGQVKRAKRAMEKMRKHDNSA